MKLIVIILTIFIMITYIIKKGIDNIEQHEPFELLQNYKIYSYIYTTSNIIFYSAIMINIILILVL